MCPQGQVSVTTPSLFCEAVTRWHQAHRRSSSGRSLKRFASVLRPSPAARMFFLLKADARARAFLSAACVWLIVGWRITEFCGVRERGKYYSYR